MEASTSRRSWSSLPRRPRRAAAPKPTPKPTPEPTPKPTAKPTPKPTPEPTPEQTAQADGQADAQAEALPPKPQDGEGEDASELSAWPDVVVWRVRPGDSLAAIAREYKTTVEAIATLNGLVDADWIVVGRALRVPRGYPPPAAADAFTAEELRHLRDWSDIVAWRVRPGDSLRAIAAQFDTSIAAIIQLNGIAHRDLIFVGRQLQVPLGFLPEERG